jgi:hypothetical protein
VVDAQHIETKPREPRRLAGPAAAVSFLAARGLRGLAGGSLSLDRQPPEFLAQAALRNAMEKLRTAL